MKEYGFVAINLNPDPSGGHWTSPPLSDRHWYPIYEKMVEYDIPAMIHVSTSCNACFHTTGAHYLNADTTAFMQCLTADLFRDFPTLKFVIPHGGGAVPVPLGTLPRARAGAEEAAAQGPPAQQHLLRHLRVPPAGHRPADQGDPRRQRAVRLRDDRRGARHRPGDRPLLRRHEALHRRRGADARTSATRSTKATRGGCIRGSTPRCGPRASSELRTRRNRHEHEQPGHRQAQHRARGRARRSRSSRASASRPSTRRWAASAS